MRLRSIIQWGFLEELFILTTYSKLSHVRVEGNLKEWRVSHQDLELGVSYESEHAMFVFLGLDYLTHCDLSSSIHHKIYDFIFLYSKIVSHSVHVSHSYYPSVSWRTYKFFPFPRYCVQNSNEHGWANKVESFGHMPRSGIARRYSSFIFSLLRFSTLIFRVVDYFSILLHSHSSFTYTNLRAHET